MLVRVKYKTEQKYIKITDVTLQSFLKLGCSKFNIKEQLQKDLKVYDESGTEIEDDVFEDLLKDPNCGILKLVAIDETQVSPDESLNSSADLSSCDSDETVIMPPNKRQRQECKAESMIENILLKKPGGDRVIKEYTRTKMLTDATRRQMVNILTAEMTETHGTSPPRDVRELYAKGIVSLFPYLKDPYSKNGYEHYYDSESGSGYLAWRLKTIQRKASTESPKPSSSSCLGGPTSKRPPSLKIDSQLNEDQIREAVSLMKHSSDEALVKEKMRLTFSYRQKMVHDPQKCSDMLSVFPRFKDVKGLIEQDFVLLFGWDSDLSSLILLLHLLPPSAQGRKKPGKMSVTQATGYLVVFIKAGTNIQEHLDSTEDRRQPYLLAVGTARSRIHAFYIVVDKVAIPCKAASSLCAFDELFKAHFVFGTAYCESLRNLYTFIQTTIYKIDIGKVKESPRVAELRARFVQ
ncbi:hypothetical protein MHYP_G00113230 [Metynnis hypsauchen]